MKPKHTPSPWHLVRTEIGELELGGGIEQSTGVYSSKGFGLVANVIFKKTNILGDSYKLQKDEFEANANVIVTAPELLDELEKAHTIIQAMLNKLTAGAKHELAQQLSPIINEGLTRAHEREAVINKAKGHLSHG